jgi:antitoxin MazE
MTMRIARWGNSLAVRLPKTIAEQAGLGEGTQVDVAVEGGRLVVTPVQGPSLDELAGAITESNRHTEVDWGGPKGSEAW